MSEEKLRKAFSRIKEDILYLQQEIIILKEEIRQINKIFNQILSNLASNTYPTHIQQKQTIPTHILRNYGLNLKNFHSSIGNEGVPTNSQQIVNRQEIKQEKELKQTSSSLSNLSNLPNISNIVITMKQDLEEKFKKLTKQEFLVFSILYMLEQELQYVTYHDIAKKANLAESSIRDYISRLERKGIPILKERINNKVVILKIPKELKEIATLDNLSRLVKF